MAENEYIEVILKNDALKIHNGRAGIYEEYQTFNGKKSWKSGNNAIWFLPDNNNWVIGPLDKIGTKIISIASSDGPCDFGHPYDVPNDQLWYYSDHMDIWIKPTHSADIIIKRVKGASQKPDDSKKHLKLFKNLKEQFMNDEFSDVKIICDGKTFDCHKFILLCQSDFFKGLLRHEKSGEITLNEISADTFEKILFFMYNDSMEKSKIDSELLQASDKFLMEDLVAICIEHLKSNLTLENALDILIVAYQTNQNSLLDAASQFALKHKGQLKAEKWNEMIRKYPTLVAKAMGQVMLGISS